MPKQRITKEMVVEAAFEAARSGGMEQITVKGLAEKLGCSVQPIYSYCESMEGLRQDVIRRVKRFVREYAAECANPQEPFRSIGQAYVTLAKDEPHLFKIFILHQRNGISSLDDLYREEADRNMAKRLAEELRIGREEARQLHLQMLIYTIGLGAIFSMTSPGISTDEIFAQQEKAYRAFLEQAKQDRQEQEQKGGFA